MDYSVYSINTVSNEKVAELIDQRKSFVLEDVGRLNMTEAVATLEKVIESKGLKCRVYTKGRMATMAAAAIPISRWKDERDSWVCGPKKPSTRPA